MDLFLNADAKARKKIATLNMNNYIKKAQELFGLADADVKAAEQEYRHFLYLIHRNRREGHRQSIVPTKRADSVWHAHLLSNTEYNMFCIDLYSEIIGHNSGLEEGTSPFNSAVEHTKMIHARFGGDGFDPGYFSQVGTKRSSDKRDSQVSSGCSSDCSSVSTGKNNQLVDGGQASVCGSTCGGGGGGCGGD